MYSLVHYLNSVDCPVKGQVFTRCGLACPPNCTTPNPICTKQCVPRCECPKGTIINEATNKCVPEYRCPLPSTGKTVMYVAQSQLQAEYA